MEQQPKAEKEQQLEQDPKPEVKTREDSHPPHQDAPSEDACDKIGLVMASEENSSRTVDQLQSPSLTGSTPNSVHWSPELVTESLASNNNNISNVPLDESNPYVTSSPAPSSPSSSSSFSFKETVGSVWDAIERWRKKVGEATKKAEDLAGNTWQHLKTGPSFADAALGRIAQGTKVLAEGGYEKIFRQAFETVPEEQLLNSYACFLSTSAGPIMGILYVSTAKLAFCSDNPLSYKFDGQTEWSYYKVVIPLHQIKAVNPSSSGTNPAEKFIQVISVDNHEFWFMGFLNYDGAVQHLQDAMHAGDIQTA